MKKGNQRMSNRAQEIIFKVVLAETDPVVWRRLKLSSNMTLDDLSNAIQGAFGWSGGHGHQFNFGKGKRYSSNDFGDDNDEDNMGIPVPKDSKHVRLSEFLNPKHKPFRYEYDFGDSWLHVVSIGAVTPVEQPIKIPKCIAGENHAPPEDCGGTPGFENFKKAMANKRDSEHSSLRKWYGGDFDPQEFNLGEANKRIKKFISLAPPF